jgi:hypothetical protein
MSFPRHLMLALISAIALMASAVPAFAQTAAVTIVSEPGDYIGQGREYSFTTDINASASTDARVVSVSSFSGNEWFFLDFAAPQGQQLAVGAYEGAVRYPFQGASQPGLSYAMTGRGCNTLTGRFDVTEAEYGPMGYLVRFSADFEQHCEGGSPALFGHVSISNPPPPPALSIDVVVSNQAVVKRANGEVVLSGIVTCSADASVQVSGTASQRAGRFHLAQGTFSTATACSTAPTPWSATLASSTGTPFNQGQAQVDATASGYDSNYGGYITDTTSAVVNLVTSKKVTAKQAVAKR